jgi:class 3 adenylate cyclase
VLDAFYDECAEAIWNHDGLLNKTMGDAVMAIFNFPIRHDNHPEQAVLAAREIQDRWHIRRAALAKAGSASEEAIGVGVGIDCGEVQFGEFGRTHHDLTAIGTVVNRAARAQAAAGPDGILVTKAVYDRAPGELQQSAPEDFSLKGFSEPITLWAA